jgi:putative GTP pyrophosphokinase
VAKPKTSQLDVDQAFSGWFALNQQRFITLKDAVVTIVTSLLTDSNVDFLAINGRTKDLESALGKIARKGYNNPQSQMTDIAGVRIILFFESDVKRVAEIIRRSFAIDEKNSSNTDDRMSADQVGYRSLHFVCDLGNDRIRLPEFATLAGLKFEFQVRTVLQHAWAELAHDRNYKFSGTLPRPLERRLFLLAGLLETADQGFDDLSLSIDEYLQSVSDDSARGDLDIEINSISLAGFVEQWAKENGIVADQIIRKESSENDLIRELKEYGVSNLADLNEIIPKDFVEKARPYMRTHTVAGLVRRWMILNDPDRFVDKVDFKWTLARATKELIKGYFPGSRGKEVLEKFSEARDRNASQR